MLTNFSCVYLMLVGVDMSGGRLVLLTYFWTKIWYHITHIDQNQSLLAAAILQPSFQ